MLLMKKIFLGFFFAFIIILLFPFSSYADDFSTFADSNTGSGAPNVSRYKHNCASR